MMRSTTMIRSQLMHVAAAAVWLIAPATVLGQSREVPAPVQDRMVVIHSATIHTGTGAVLENGSIAFADGVITGVTAGMPDVGDAMVIDGSGIHIYPGLIASETNLGLTEVGAVDVTNDYTELGRVKPEVRAAVAINPDSDLLSVCRANGILTAHVLPSGGLVSGRSSLVRLDGWTWEDMAIDDTAGLVVSWPRTEPINSRWMRRSAAEQRKEIAEDLKRVEQVFDDAAAYLVARENDPAVKTDLRYEAMAPALRGEQPIYVRASSMGQIESAVGWALRRGLRIVIVGGHQADRVAPLLARHDIPVILGGLHRLPARRHSAFDEPFTVPLRLHEAGVRFCIASGAGAAHERNLNHVAATAAAYGLPKEAALAAVTRSAAEILGLTSHGTLEAGKAATFIITDGDPLEITTNTLEAFIDGRRIDLGSRHKALYEKYREKYRQLGIVD